MSIYVGFVVDQWLLFRFYLEYFGFPLSLLFHQCFILIIIHLPSTLIWYRCRQLR